MSATPSKMQQMLARAKAGTLGKRPASTRPASNGKGDDVKAVVLQVTTRQGRKPTILCFLHALSSAKLGPTTTTAVDADGAVSLRMKCKKTGTVVRVPSHAMLEVCNNSETPDAMRAGDAIVLCNVRVNKGTSRTFYDASFTRPDYSTTGYSELTRSKRSMFRVEPFDPEERYGASVLLPVVPIAAVQADAPVGASAVVTGVGEVRSAAGDAPYARVDVNMMQWTSNADVDAIFFPRIRLWESTLSRFGVMDADTWAELATTILTRTSFFVRGYVHGETTARLQDEQALDAQKIEAQDENDRAVAPDANRWIGMRATAIVVDPHQMLRDVGHPIDVAQARRLLQNAPASSDDASHPWNGVASSGVVNLSEATEALRSATLLAHDKLYVVSSEGGMPSENHAYMVAAERQPITPTRIR